ncbi:hypothetical protein H5V43_18520 [Sphingobium fuliginis]|jgi:hypothetical protein|uniref:Phage integrase central domain-containing protein n=1 Tax=Sphingobium fuliginis (strain ATCC 27551) TaxID=336203 RepID=A0A7M2GPV0_SPHSA|nr:MULTISPECIES: hypothetical protein [Sphingobium]AJR23421.1 hypothetical protein TZ53_06450 [Sphingobium sp. YBL2]QOT74122.1 hypothetical protein H5V43_18520 [Sphingobium fuliginis]
MKFEKLAYEWMEKKRCDWGKKNFNQIESYLKRDVFPYIGELSVRSITSAMMLEVLHRIERGASPWFLTSSDRIAVRYFVRVFQMDVSR